MSCNLFWAMYDGQLILYPKVLGSSDLELVGYLKPPDYADSDLNKSMVKEVTDSDTEVQGLSHAQLKLVRYRVMSRIAEDVGNYDLADRLESKAVRIRHEMQETHSDGNFTDTTGRVSVDDG
jgi:hypothetical protein